MRTISRYSFGAITAACVFAASNAQADSDRNFYQSNAQYGMYLPNASLPSGQDEIRTADGASCRSAVGGDGAYLDAGVIGSPGTSDMESSAAVYSRVVVPLGRAPKRLDCTVLYNLEIQRLQMELKLARMGLAGGGASSPQAQATSNWQEEGWSDASGAAKKPAPKAADVTSSTRKAAPRKDAVITTDSVY